MCKALGFGRSTSTFLLRVRRLGDDWYVEDPELFSECPVGVRMNLENAGCSGILNSGARAGSFTAFLLRDRDDDRVREEGSRDLDRVRSESLPLWNGFSSEKLSLFFAFFLSTDYIFFDVVKYSEVNIDILACFVSFE